MAWCSFTGLGRVSAIRSLPSGKSLSRHNKYLFLPRIDFISFQSFLSCTRPVCIRASKTVSYSSDTFLTGCQVCWNRYSKLPSDAHGKGKVYYHSPHLPTTYFDIRNNRWKLINPLFRVCCTKPHISRHNFHFISEPVCWMWYGAWFSTETALTDWMWTGIERAWFASTVHWYTSFDGNFVPLKKTSLQ